ncbi:MAG TPA: threonine/serine dehydratase, partial [Thermoanaerobaculia bacterium]|nr:threonine/serine dehydratase [Thermoanaerobaculia bacterium]
MTLPIHFEDALAARERIRPFLPATPLRSYPALDDEIGAGIRVLVKHENHQPTNAFKIRNALSALTLLSAEQRSRGVVAATRGNHGMGVALAGRLLGAPVTICVPVGNNPEKNLAIRGYGATLIEQGRDYDETVDVAKALVRDQGLHLVHSTNDPAIIAGAATMGLEILEEAPDVDAIVVSIGGGSQAVGALVAVSGLRPGVEVYGVQAAGAPAIYEGWRAGRAITLESAATFADGLATRSCYELTFAALRSGLRDFVVASEAELADAVRLMLRTTHNLAEGAGAASLAGLRLLRDRLAGRKVVVILSGSNIDAETL